MSKQGDDCYFYFYSTCNKGDSCAFRHCEAALGNETVCTLWQEGRCFRNICRFRHMEIDKKRSEIPCYWENQPMGCQKSNCAFHHTKGRYVDGVFLPPSKTTLPSPAESAEDDVKNQTSLQMNKLSVQSNPSPQLRGVMKVDGSESVPSPTHPPLVINAGDDDEDDDDQLSEEGDETKAPVQQPATESHNGLRIISTKKSNANTKQDDNLNFGIKTLEEIKLNKQKEKTKKQNEGPSGVSGHPLQSLTSPVPEKENVRTVVRTVTLSTKHAEEPVIQLNLSERMGKRKAPTAVKSDPLLKPNLTERLGKKIEVLENKTEVLENADKPPKKGKAAKPAGEIHVKTLEEIRIERANQGQGDTVVKPQAEGRKMEDSSPGARPSPAVRIKSFSGALAEKNHKRLEEEKQKPEKLPSKRKAESGCKKQSILVVPSVPSRVLLAEIRGKTKPLGEVHIKTLEEIKKEKALRMQQSGENLPAPPAQTGSPPKERRLLRITKLIAPGREEKKIVEFSKPFAKTVSAPAESSDQNVTISKVQVKSLEEIMREKQQLKQRQEKALQKEAAAVPSPNLSSLPFTPAKSKVCLKALDGKASFPTKKSLKRKFMMESPPCAVKRHDEDTMEPPAKKPALDAVPALPEESLVTVPQEEKGKASSELHVKNQEDSVAQSEVSSPTSTSSQAATVTRRLSSTGIGKAPSSVEDDFEKLIWEISGGKLEAEIDLDPGKDEDDLLLELSEMIDS
ncbi:ZC11A protein, partial [Geococcyx californianus]|nr:ZC11A protein [Geococcyx californianus]